MLIAAGQQVAYTDMKQPTSESRGRVSHEVVSLYSGSANILEGWGVKL